MFQLAEVAVSREVFRQVLERIAGLHPAPRVANILEVIRGEEGQPRARCVPGEFEASANVVKATSAAHRTPVQDAAGWVCEA